MGVGGTSGCAGSTTGLLTIGSARTMFIVAHELGHWLAWAADDHKMPRKSYLADADDCPNEVYVDDGDPTTSAADGHRHHTKEYQGAAAIEGFASFYAAITFNDTYGSGCTYKKGDSDFDLNSTVSDDANYWSCDDAFTSNLTTIDAYDYLGDHCIASGESANRGTQLDWLRHFWDLMAEEGLTFGEIVDIWGSSDPCDWNETGNGTGAGYPAYELRQAADAQGLLSEWDSWDNTEGVHR